MSCLWKRCHIIRRRLSRSLRRCCSCCPLFVRRRLLRQGVSTNSITSAGKQPGGAWPPSWSSQYGLSNQSASLPIYHRDRPPSELFEVGSGNDSFKYIQNLETSTECYQGQPNPTNTLQSLNRANSCRSRQSAHTSTPVQNRPCVTEELAIKLPLLATPFLIAKTTACCPLPSATYGSIGGGTARSKLKKSASRLFPGGGGGEGIRLRPILKSRAKKREKDLSASLAADGLTGNIGGGGSTGFGGASGLSGSGDQKLYLEEALLERKAQELDLRQLVDLPPGIDYNEWLASHTLSLFDHVNLIYGTISEFCTMTGCPDMTGPALRQYLWYDEKGKKCKVAAPQYVDYVMTFIQKTTNDECIFPTKYANDFPVSFEPIVKKIFRLLFHIISHLYHAHFRELVLLGLHPYLNATFAHFTHINHCFRLVDLKETECLCELVTALKLLPADSASKDIRSLPVSPTVSPACGGGKSFPQQEVSLTPLHGAALQSKAKMTSRRSNSASPSIPIRPRSAGELKRHSRSPSNSSNSSSTAVTSSLGMTSANMADMTSSPMVSPNMSSMNMMSPNIADMTSSNMAATHMTSVVQQDLTAISCGP